MKTPYAILIGLALIAAALFFRQPSISPAQAGILGDDGGRTHCHFHRNGWEPACVVIQENRIIWLVRYYKDGRAIWKTDEYEYH